MPVERWSDLLHKEKKNSLVPLPETLRSGHFPAERRNLPGIGLSIWLAGIRKEEAVTEFKLRQRAREETYRCWEAVRKGQDGYNGFASFFPGLGWQTDEINHFLEQTGQSMLDSITRMHRWDSAFIKRCFSALMGKRPWEHETLWELYSVFGATCGRLRALVYDDSNIHTIKPGQSQATRDTLVRQAMGVNEGYRTKIANSVRPTPPMVYEYNPVDPEAFTVTMYFPAAPISPQQPKTDVGLFMGQIGCVDHPSLSAAFGVPLSLRGDAA